MFGKQSCWIKNSSERSVEWTCGKDYQFHVRSVWYCLFCRSVWQIKKALSYLGFFYKDTERNKTNKKLECIRGLKETTLLSSCRWAGETNYANIAFFSCTQMALWTGRGHDPLRLQLPPPSPDCPSLETQRSNVLFMTSVCYNLWCVQVAQECRDFCLYVITAAWSQVNPTAQLQQLVFEYSK